ncbi:DUF2332 family protein [Candidatus Woesebacteria bacterium]|nr:DUF2332 family protein [Candidatus Woesebacteria bacterium]
MTEQYRPVPKELEKKPQQRDYTRASDVVQAIERLVAGLKEDGDEYRMFELLGSVVKEDPDVLMPVICGSIDLAQRKLAQSRKDGSSATLLYPIDAAIRVTAQRKMLLETNPLSAGSWNVQKVLDVLRLYPAEVIELAGSNTTSKNLPQRAAHLLWLLDQCPLVQQEQSLTFLEIGASGGLILDALQQPTQFKQWMQSSGYRSDFGLKSDPSRSNRTYGIDLVKPELDWLQAIILEDELRRETTEFIEKFSRSQVSVESATNLSGSESVANFLAESAGSLPVVFSCFVFYQLDAAVREDVTNQARAVLKKQGGGLLIVSDIAKYRGFPDKSGGCVSWVEDQDGRRVSPRILLSKSTLTEWEEV